jgi:hypothetical protein
MSYSVQGQGRRTSGRPGRHLGDQVTVCTALCLHPGGRFGTDLGAAFRRETRHSVPATVEFELRLLNSAGRGGETDGPLVLTQADRDRLKHIQEYTEWLLAESLPPSTHTGRQPGGE